MKIYPSQIRRSVRLLKLMCSNSRKMMMWKNYPLAKEVVAMLDALQERSGRHSPYDKIFLMKILLDNISKSDTPRFAIRSFWTTSLRATLRASRSVSSSGRPHFSSQ